MGVSMNGEVAVAPVRVHGLEVWNEWTTDHCPCQIHLLLGFTCTDDLCRNTVLIVSPGNTNELPDQDEEPAWKAVWDFATDDKTADEIAVWMSEHDMRHLIDGAWDDSLMVVEC